MRWEPLRLPILELTVWLLGTMLFWQVAVVDPEFPEVVVTSFFMLFRTMPVMSLRAFCALLFMFISPVLMLNGLGRAASVDLISSAMTRLPLSALRLRCWGGLPSF